MQDIIKQIQNRMKEIKSIVSKDYSQEDKYMIEYNRLDRALSVLKGERL